MRRHLLTVYFDTELGDLRRHRVALRMRRQRRGYIMALKWGGAFAGGLFERGETEISMPSADPEIERFGQEVATSLGNLTQGRPLIQSFTTDVKRACRRVRIGVSEIEVAFDIGYITAGDRDEPLREIELELKSGELGDLYQFGLSLIEAFPMRLGLASKSDRGILLATDQRAHAVRASAPTIGLDQNLDDIICAVIRSCVLQFSQNLPAFESGESKEAIHQMRVSMRRLRAALSLFQKDFPCTEFLTFRADAKHLASAMGEARNWDVFLDLVRDIMHNPFGAEPGFDPLLTAAESRRQAGYDIVRSTLMGMEPTRFLLSIEQFLTRRGWRNAQNAQDLAKLTAPGSEFAACCLERLHRRVCKKGRRLHELRADERHEVRIALKNLRYAAEFFSALYDRPAVVHRYLRAVVRLQDVLGSSNDMVMAIDQLQRLKGPEDAELARPGGIMIGWYGRGALADNVDLKRAWSKFRKAERFW